MFLHAPRMTSRFLRRTARRTARINSASCITCHTSGITSEGRPEGHVSCLWLQEVAGSLHVRPFVGDNKEERS